MAVSEYVVLLLLWVMHQCPAGKVNLAMEVKGTTWSGIKIITWTESQCHNQACARDQSHILDSWARVGPNAKMVRGHNLARKVQWQRLRSADTAGVWHSASGNDTRKMQGGGACSPHRDQCIPF